MGWQGVGDHGALTRSLELLDPIPDGQGGQVGRSSSAFREALHLPNLHLGELEEGEGEEESTGVSRQSLFLLADGHCSFCWAEAFQGREGLLFAAVRLEHNS